MPKYYQGQEFREAKPNPVGQGISNAFESLNADLRMKADIAKYNDPNTSSFQKLLIMTKYAGQPAAAALVKSDARESQLKQFFGGGEPVVDNIIPGETERPDVSQLRNAMQIGAFGNQMGSPSPMNALTAARTNESITPQTKPQPTAPSGGMFSGKSDDELIKGVAAFPELAPAIEEELKKRRENEKREQEKEKFKQQVFQKDRDWNTQMSADFRKHITGIKRSLPATEAALQLSRNAIESGELGPWSANNLASILGRPELLSASGAALNLAAKENLLGNLARVSGRAQNKWLEQVALSAFPRAGQSMAANLTIQEGIEADLALRKAQSDAYDLISQQDMQKQGYEGADIEKRVNEAIRPIEDEILKRTSYRTRSIYEGEKSQKELSKLANKKAPFGTPLTREMFRVMLRKTGSPEKAIERAKQLGYVIYPTEKIQEYIE